MVKWPGTLNTVQGIRKNDPATAVSSLLRKTWYRSQLKVIEQGHACLPDLGQYELDSQYCFDFWPFAKRSLWLLVHDIRLTNRSPSECSLCTLGNTTWPIWTNFVAFEYGPLQQWWPGIWPSCEWYEYPAISKSFHLLNGSLGSHPIPNHHRTLWPEGPEETPDGAAEFETSNLRELCLRNIHESSKAFSKQSPAFEHCNQIWIELIDIRCNFEFAYLTRVFKMLSKKSGSLLMCLINNRYSSKHSFVVWFWWSPRWLYNSLTFWTTSSRDNGGEFENERTSESLMFCMIQFTNSNKPAKMV